MSGATSAGSGSGDDWIDDLVKRGLLTKEQAAEARRNEAGGTNPPPGAPVPATPSTPARESGALFTCPPCGKVYSIPGGDPASPPACPDCRGALRPVQLGGIISTSPAPPSTADGQSFGRYRIRGELGRGGMGVVYEAWDPLIGRPVALKMLSAPGKELDANAVERLLREARAAAKLRHPGIVAIHDIGQADGRHYFTMDLVSGEGFDHMIAEAPKAGALRLRVEILAETGEALGAAHAQGIVHRDIKPSNIIVDRGGRALLLDFGLARDNSSASGEALTVSGTLLGTPHYMSPEQATRTARAAGPASDVFSLGVVLYRALCGRLPFEGDEVQVLLAIVREDPPPPSKWNPDVPRDLDTICLKSLEKNAAGRYADGAALAADLRRWIAGEPIEARPVSWTSRLWRRVTRPRTLPSATQEDVRRVEAENRSAVDRAKNQAEAMKLLEQARPALDRARQALYEKEASWDDIVRRAGEAQARIEQALARAPDLALGHYLLGLALSIRGDEDRAEVSWREAVRLDPDLGPAHFHLGRLLVERGFALSRSWRADEKDAHAGDARKWFAEGESELSRALQLGSGFDEVAQRQLAAAMSAHVRGDLPGAAQLCRRAIDEFPGVQGREAFHWLLGLCEGSPEERLGCFNRALEIRPKDAFALTSRVTLLFQLGRAEGCLPDLDAALRLMPNYFAARISRGMLRLQGGDGKGALEDFEAAVAKIPDSAVGWVNRGTALAALGDNVGALADYEKAIRLNPRYARAWANVCGCRRDSGDFQGAIAAGDEAIRVNPSLPAAWLNRGLSRHSAGDPLGAIADNDEALKLRPDYFLAYNNRGSARIALRDGPGAVADYDVAVRLGPTSQFAWSGRAEARLLVGDISGALADCARALELKPERPLTHVTHAEALERSGDIAAAAASFERAMQLAPADAEVRLERALFRKRSGDLPGAAADAGAALALAAPGWKRRADAEGLLPTPA